jgi:hypothetical protein
MGPAGAAIGRLQPACGGLSDAVKEHDGSRVTHFLRHHHFDVHGAMHGFLAGLAHVSTTGVEETSARDIGGGDRRNGFHAHREGGGVGVHCDSECQRCKHY